MTKYIETEWNVTTGCSVMSDACLICSINPYIEHHSKYDPLFKNKLAPKQHEQNIQLPTNWHKPRIIKVAPYSDLFNPTFNSEFIKQVFSVIEDTPRHIYMLTTKNPKRASNASNIIGWPTNLWAGTSIESNKYINRLEDLANIPSLVKYVEFQPVLEYINEFDAPTIIDFISVLADITNTKAFDIQWLENIQKFCINNNTPILKKDKHGHYISTPQVTTFTNTISIDSKKTPNMWTINDHNDQTNKPTLQLNIEDS